jgi:hypothetical protein
MNPVKKMNPVSKKNLIKQLKAHLSKDVNNTTNNNSTSFNIMNFNFYNRSENLNSKPSEKKSNIEVNIKATLDIDEL